MYELFLFLHEVIHSVDTPTVALLADVLFPAWILVKKHFIENACFVGFVATELTNAVNLVVKHAGLNLVGVASEYDLLKHRVAGHDGVISAHQTKLVVVDLLDLADRAKVEF